MDIFSKFLIIVLPYTLEVTQIPQYLLIFPFGSRVFLEILLLSKKKPSINQRQVSWPLYLFLPSPSGCKVLRTASTTSSHQQSPKILGSPLLKVSYSIKQHSGIVLHITISNPRSLLLCYHPVCHLLLHMLCPLQTSMSENSDGV